MTAPFEKKTPGPSLHTTVSGHVTLAVGKDARTSREVRADFPNMVLNSGLDTLLGRGENTAECHVGSSAVAVTPEQTTLIARIARTSRENTGVHTVTSVSPYTITSVVTYRFSAGEAAGNVAEVGFGSTDILFSRALVRDSEGQPAVVTVLADEYLDVSYVLTTIIDTSDVPFTMNLSTGSVSGVLRPCNRQTLGAEVSSISSYPPVPGNYLMVYTGSLGDIFSEPQTDPGGESTGDWSYPVTAPYVKGSFYRDHTIEMDVGVGNLPGGAFSAMRLNSSGDPGFQLSFDPPVPKTAERVFTFSIRVSVGRG